MCGGWEREIIEDGSLISLLVSVKGTDLAGMLSLDILGLRCMWVEISSKPSEM